MSISVSSLPPSLILLVHLHIMEYPHANKEEYDHNIFNPRTRGLKDRNKTLEDLAYFLVGKLERNVKSIFPTYPCSHPSDTVAFRTSFAKYLESLRHQSLFGSSSKAVNRSNGRNKDKDLDAEAWWWKDVPIRKSLLEECSGDRFERLILSVSTHVLLRSIPQSLLPPTRDMQMLLQKQPYVYTEILNRCKLTWRSWFQAASRLLQRGDDMRLLRERLASNFGQGQSSRYASFSTERLVALLETKLQDLLLDVWHGEEGRSALLLLAELVGLKLQLTYPPAKSNVEDLIPCSKDEEPTPPAPYPLPITAAHHPSYLKKFRKPIFHSLASRKSKQNQNFADPGLQHLAAPQDSTRFARLGLASYLESELNAQQALTGALARVKKRNTELKAKLDAMVAAKVQAKTRHKAAAKGPLSLWRTKTQGRMINYDTEPTPELLSALGLYKPDKEAETLENKILRIREELPDYPPIPDLSSARLPVLEESSLTVSAKSFPTEQSKLPRARADKTSDATLRIHKLVSAEAPVTSTPPSTIHAKPGAARRTARDASETVQGGQAERPRKSIRLSLAANRLQRPSLFAPENPMQEEIDRILDDFDDDPLDHDHDGDDIESETILALVTPKAKGALATPVHRLFTGTRTSTVKKPKQSFPMVFKEPVLALPSLVSASESFAEFALGSSDEDEDDDAQAGPIERRDVRTDHALQGQTDAASQRDEVEDIYEYREMHSMTLRDILLKADTTQFDLMGEDVEDQDRIEEESFRWE